MLKLSQWITWTKGLLGSHSPDVLQYEWFVSAQSLNVSSSGEMYLLYRETGSKLKQSRQYQE